MKIELTQAQRDTLGEGCVGYGEYGCTEDHTHKHNLGCRLFGPCGRKNGDLERSELVEAVERIAADQVRAALERVCRDMDIARAVTTAALGHGGGLYEDMVKDVTDTIRLYVAAIEPAAQP